MNQVRFADWILALLLTPTLVPASGCPAAEAPAPSTTLRLNLPFRKGQTFPCGQGFGGHSSHTESNYYALDFLMPEGTPVVAAAAGRVVEVRQNFTRGGNDPALKGEANQVLLDHGGGWFTQYGHLKVNGATVREGNLVSAGQVIGYSGNTGFSTAPHLHFMVCTYLEVSAPCRFLDVEGDGIPRDGRRYTSGNDGADTSPFAGDSLLPKDAWRQNGIELIDPPPSRCFEIGREYMIRGVLADHGAQAALLFYRRTGTTGQPLLRFLAPSDPSSGRFELKAQVAVPLKEAESGGLRMALVSVSARRAVLERRYPDLPGRP